MQYFLLDITTDSYNQIGVVLIVLSTFIIFGFQYFNDKYNASSKNDEKNQTNCQFIKKIIFIQF